MGRAPKTRDAVRRKEPSIRENTSPLGDVQLGKQILAEEACLAEFAKSVDQWTLALMKRLKKKHLLRIAAVATELAKRLQCKHPSDRKAAVADLRHLVEFCQGVGRRPLFDEIPGVLSGLIAAVAAPDDDVKHNAVLALRQLTPYRNPTEIARTLKEHALNPASKGDVVGAALGALRECGVDVASGAIAELVSLLTHSDIKVRQNTCDVLGWLEGDAAIATTEVLQVALEDPEPSIRLAAMWALMAIDEDGKWLGPVANDESNTARITQLLCEIGVDGRPLRRKLLNLATPTTNIPPSGTLTIKKRQSKFHDLYVLHDQLRAENPNITDHEILRAYLAKFKAPKIRGNTWKEPTDRTLENYRNRRKRNQE